MSTELEARLQRLEDENQTLRQSMALVEARVQQLTQLYVASHRLHEATARGDLLVAIEDIVTNLLGSEELAIHERVEGSSQLRLVRASGVDPVRWANVKLGEGLIGASAASGTTWVTPGARTGACAGEEQLTACVPLRLFNQVIGTVSIFRLLPQKGKLAPGDHELLALLGAQAGLALHASRFAGARGG
jgi:hypothetical protein